MYQPSTFDRLTNHTLVIAGLGREGWSSYQFLRARLPTVPILLVDDQPLEKLDRKWSKATAKDQYTSFISSEEAKTLPANAFLITTPGLPPTHPLRAHQQLPTTSNTQLFFDLLQTGELGLKPGSFTTIGVTGTKGKSTTTSLIDHVLKKAGLLTYLGGNIGVPPLDLVINLKPTTKHIYFVLEMSSHQLAELHTSPMMAVVQNIVPEHLDYYASFDEYFMAKTNLTRWQTAQDTVIFNPDFARARQLANLSHGHHLSFRVETFDHWLLYQDEPIIKLKDIPLVGEHNLQNVMPAIVIAKQLRIATTTIAEAIRSFTALQDRLELVATIDQVKYYNDSLSTVPEAAMAALKAFTDQSVILLAGGYDRQQDFTELAVAIINHPVKTVLLFPTTGQRLAEAIKTYCAGHPASHLPQLIEVKTMAEAVQQAAAVSQSGDIVLLSPASASFGEFKDYRDRGEQFKIAVKKVSTNR